MNPALLIGGTLAITAVGYFASRAISEGRLAAGKTLARRAYDWKAQRDTAINSLLSCVFRVQEAQARRAAQNLGIQLSVTTVALIAGTSPGAALKLGGKAVELRNRISGGIAGCDAEAAEFEERWNWVLGEAEALGIDVSIGDEDFIWWVIELQGGVEEIERDLMARRTAEFRKWHVQLGYAPEDAFRAMGGEGWADEICIRDYRKSKRGYAELECGRRTPAWWRGETQRLHSKTNAVFRPTTRLTGRKTIDS